MSWIGIGALTYLAICWVGSLILIDFGSNCEENLDAETRESLNTLQTERPLRMFLVRAAVVIFLGPLLPALFIYGFFAERRDMKQYRAFLQEYHPAVYDEIHEANLPREAAEQFAEIEPLLRRVSFQEQATYLVKEKPLEVYNRCFLSPDGTMVADISMIDGNLSYSLTSVLADGHVVETACFDGDPEFERVNQSGRFTAKGIPLRIDAEAFRELHETHSNQLTELERRRGSTPRQFVLDEVRDAMRYAHSVMDEIRFELGDLSSGPEKIECPPGIASRSTAHRSSTSNAIA